jgi:alpha-galactosidase
VAQPAGFEIWKKELEGGSLAVGLFNRGEKKGTTGIDWADLQIEGKWRVRDLWRQKDLGTYQGRFEAVVPRHGVVLVRLSRAE